MNMKISKKLISALLALVLVLGGYLLTELGILEPAPPEPTSVTTRSPETTAPTTLPQQTEPPQTEAPAETASPTVASDEAPLIDENGHYYSAEEVALYLHTYGHLPENYLTKSAAQKLGWDGGSIEKYAPGYAIGGDRFGNREGLLPRVQGRQYYECDIDTQGHDSRGAKRLVYSNDGLIYYTEDHYESFILLYGEE